VRRGINFGWVQLADLDDKAADHYGCCGGWVRSVHVQVLRVDVSIPASECGLFVRSFIGELSTAGSGDNRTIVKLSPKCKRV
jgi:hypothetical protein